MRARGAVILGGAGLLVVLAVGGGFALAAAGLGDQAGTPIGVDAVTIETPATDPPAADPTATGVPTPGATPGPGTDGPPPVITVPDPTPVPADDHGGDRPGKGGDDGGGHGSDD